MYNSEITKYKWKKSAEPFTLSDRGKKKNRSYILSHSQTVLGLLPLLKLNWDFKISQGKTKQNFPEVP